MRTILIPLLLLLTAAGLSGGCEKSSGEKTVREADDGQEVLLAIGDTVEIILEGNPTTGHQWEIAAFDEQLLELVYEPFYTPDAADNLIGSGGRYHTRFRARQRGQSTVSLRYRQAGSGTDTRTFMINILVY